MGQYSAETFVAVYPFIRQAEGEEVLIGNIDSSTFLLLPPDAVELLDLLADGKTVGEAHRIYQEKYHEEPDLEGLLLQLEGKGFVRPQTSSDLSHSDAVKDLIRSSKSKAIRYHFANFPQALAQQLFGRSALNSYCFLIGVALVVVAIDPSLLPGWKAHFFTRNSTLYRLILVGISYLVLFLHEMAHLIAARAVDIPSRMGISNRMWFLVAETDMSGIWSVPRKQRYIPFLAGPLLDAISASLLILILFAHKCGWLLLHADIYELIRAVLLIYILQLLWQFYFFVRTDFYFVFSNIFRCKNLMKDTEVFLQNSLTRLFPLRRVSQSHIPRSERRLLPYYASLWIIGRVVAIATLIFVQLPLSWNYGVMIVTTFKNGYQAAPYAFTDALLMLFIFFVPQVFGFWLWIRSFRTTQG